MSMKQKYEGKDLQSLVELVLQQLIHILRLHPSETGFRWRSQMNPNLRRHLDSPRRVTIRDGLTVCLRATPFWRWTRISVTDALLGYILNLQALAN